MRRGGRAQSTDTRNIAHLVTVGAEGEQVIIGWCVFSLGDFDPVSFYLKGKEAC